MALRQILRDVSWRVSATHDALTALFLAETVGVGHLAAAELIFDSLHNATTLKWHLNIAAVLWSVGDGRLATKVLGI